jgi:hypothetical protein
MAKHKQQRHQRQQQQNPGGNANDDDTSRAPESGDPRESGRQQGHVIDEDGTPGDADPSGERGDSDFESGRHGTK